MYIPLLYWFCLARQETRRCFSARHLSRLPSRFLFLLLLLLLRFPHEIHALERTPVVLQRAANDTIRDHGMMLVQYYMFGIVSILYHSAKDEARVRSAIWKLPLKNTPASVFRRAGCPCNIALSIPFPTPPALDAELLSPLLLLPSEPLKLFAKNPPPPPAASPGSSSEAARTSGSLVHLRNRDLHPQTNTTRM